jgi:hypothetical protein
MSAMPPGLGRPVAESIRLQLGTAALVLLTPGRTLVPWSSRPCPDIPAALPMPGPSSARPSRPSMVPSVVAARRNYLDASPLN